MTFIYIENHLIWKKVTFVNNRSKFFLKHSSLHPILHFMLINDSCVTSFLWFIIWFLIKCGICKCSSNGSKKQLSVKVLGLSPWHIERNFNIRHKASSMLHVKFYFKSSYTVVVYFLTRWWLAFSLLSSAIDFADGVLIQISSASNFYIWSFFIIYL